MHPGIPPFLRVVFPETGPDPLNAAFNHAVLTGGILSFLLHAPEQHLSSENKETEKAIKKW